MKKLIFAVILFPLFAGAQTSWNAGEDSANSSEYSAESTTVEQLTTDSNSADLSRSPRCGRHSDFKCDQHRVFETCDRDNSHGIYGSCRDIGERDGEVICSCR
jgi:hypothetical protein